MCIYLPLFNNQSLYILEEPHEYTCNCASASVIVPISSYKDMCMTVRVYSHVVIQMKSL